VDRTWCAARLHRSRASTLHRHTKAGQEPPPTHTHTPARLKTGKAQSDGVPVFKRLLVRSHAWHAHTHTWLAYVPRRKRCASGTIAAKHTFKTAVQKKCDWLQWAIPF